MHINTHACAVAAAAATTSLVWRIGGWGGGGRLSAVVLLFVWCVGVAAAAMVVVATMMMGHTPRRTFACALYTVLDFNALGITRSARGFLRACRTERVFVCRTWEPSLDDS